MNKNYPINSLDTKYCKNNDLRIFKLLETCSFCKKIPLPAYKSVENQKNTYCLDCYNQKNFQSKNLIEPDIGQEFLLEKLVINCIFEEKGCKERYDINTLQKLLDHEKVCFFNPSTKLLLKQNSIYINEAIENCLRCYDMNLDGTNHDCITTLVKLILEIGAQIKNLTSKFEQQNTQNDQRFLQLERQFNDLSQKLHSLLEKQEKFQNEIQLKLTHIVNNQQNVNDMMENKFNTKITETNKINRIS